MDFPIKKMVIFHCYVSSPEGSWPSLASSNSVVFFGQWLWARTVLKIAGLKKGAGCTAEEGHTSQLQFSKRVRQDETPTGPPILCQYDNMTWYWVGMSHTSHTFLPCTVWSGPFELVLGPVQRVLKHGMVKKNFGPNWALQLRFTQLHSES